MRDKKAFTLIEILIVIAIIGVLASVVLINTGAGREKAKLAKALSAMRSIANIANMCIVSGATLALPVSNGNPGTVICSVGAELLPDISDTNFTYCGSGCGGWTSGANSHYAFSAYSDSYSGGRKIIVCGADYNANGWYGVNNWNFTGIVGCKTSGF